MEKHNCKIGFKSMTSSLLKENKPIITAKVIYKVAISTNWKLYYPSGGDAKIYLTTRKFLPVSWINGILRMVYR